MSIDCFAQQSNKVTLLSVNFPELLLSILYPRDNSTVKAFPVRIRHHEKLSGLNFFTILLFAIKLYNGKIKCDFPIPQQQQQQQYFFHKQKGGYHVRTCSFIQGKHLSHH
jgi:hypothetical protein